MIEMITEAVSNYYRVSAKDLKGSSRKAPLPEARRMLVYVANLKGCHHKQAMQAVNRSRTRVYRQITQFEDEIKVYKSLRHKLFEILIKLSKSK